MSNIFLPDIISDKSAEGLGWVCGGKIITKEERAEKVFNEYRYKISHARISVL